MKNTNTIKENRPWKAEYEKKLMTPEEAVKIVRNGDRVYIGTCTSVAYRLAEALGKRKDELKDITILSSNASRPLDVMDPDSDVFHVETYYMGPQERRASASDRADYTSFHLSQTSDWVKFVGKPDVAFLEVSAPDEFGDMRYGASGLVADPYVLECADRVVFQVNDCVPRLNGMENKLRAEQADAIVEVHDPLLQMPDLPPSDVLNKISDFLVDEIHDGDCIQLGIGGIASAVGYGLKKRNDLGIHSEMLGNSMMELMKNGNVTNQEKNFWKGKSAAGFVMGTQELYDFLDGNEDIYMAPSAVVNNPLVIAKNDNMVSVNTALAVDLTGQVVADNIGGKQYSSVGGQLDFVIGSQMSKGGRSFIALSSTFEKNGEMHSHIKADFLPGTMVTTPRADVEYVVTEYGCVNLKHLGMKDRVRAMIGLAHPKFREILIDQAKEKGLL
ncbi:MAG: acetyl-CoA hydrolase/transferase family protein [Eubacterium sp.]